MKSFYKLLLLILIIPSAHAEDISDTKYAKNVCDYGPNSRTAVGCAIKRFKVVEKLLNKQYKKSHRELNSIKKSCDKYSSNKCNKYVDIKQLHIKSQRSWIKFRENECKAIETWYRNGKLQKQLYYDCMRTIAERRIDDFKKFTGYQT